MSNNTQLETIRHSFSHVLAAAVKELWPAVKLAIGPAIENGFYYDIDFDIADESRIDSESTRISDADLPKIEERMRQLIAKDLKFERSEAEAEKAAAAEKKSGATYKAELIEDLISAGEKKVSYYTVGGFTDLCAGPHVASTGKLNPDGFKLLKLAGAYWRGDEKNKMLTRIYGVAFETAEELAGHLRILEEAEAHDHRKLGKELELFMISDEIGRGLPLWLPKGAFIRKKLEDYMYERERAAGYDYVYTPILTREELYRKSGHLAHYQDSMYSPIDIEGENYYLKPMNCPHHHIMYKNKLVSYRDLPLRLSDSSPIHRFERSGTLTGLIRARCFSQNDAHIYCARTQLKSELISVMKMFAEVYEDFDIKGYWFRLSLPDFSDREKYGDIENKEMWEESARAAREVLKELDLKFEEASGEAAFYGPKIDVQIKNVHGKEDTIATAQVDFYMPEKFDLKFVNQKGEEERPVIIHRAIMGSFDRFFSFLVEQYAGALPLWLSPTQVKILSVGETHVGFCEKLAAEFAAGDIRAEVDKADETVGNKIRKAVNEKVPYMLVVGDKEVDSDKLAVRERGSRDTRQISKEKFIEEIKEKAGRRL